jgi:hypothetical protein
MIKLSPYLAAAAVLALAACSQEPQPAPEPSATIASATPIGPVDASPATGAAQPVTADTLTLDGLGALKIGQPVPAGSGWAERGAQASDACRVVSSPDYPGVYAIVEGGKVRRITVSGDSTVKLVEGIGVGSSEKDVKSSFAGFREEPHKYVEAPAKYLTAPNAASGDPALRFEIDKDGEVSAIHIGTAPQLGYVEGCA